MQFPILPAATLLALAASATADNTDFTVAFTAPVMNEAVPLNAPYKITWTESTGEPTGSKTITVGLSGGKEPDKLLHCGNIAVGINDVGWLVWDVGTTKPDGTEWDCPDAWDDLEGNMFGIYLLFKGDSAKKPTRWSDHFKITGS